MHIADVNIALANAEINIKKGVYYTNFEEYEAQNTFLNGLLRQRVVQTSDWAPTDAGVP